MIKVGKLLCGLVLGAIALPGVASTTWDFRSTTCAANTQLASCAFASGVTMSAVGTSTQSGTTGLGAINIEFYGAANGWGAGPNTGAPTHAIDNSGKYEMILLTFATAVSLNEVKLGWNGTDITGAKIPTGSDMSVLAFTGASSPAPFPGGGDTWNSLTGAWDSSANTGGWTAIGNYATVGGTANNTANVSTINQTGKDAQTQPTSAIYSSYWLIGAYNPEAVTSGLISNGLTQADAFKLMSVTGCVGASDKSANCVASSGNTGSTSGTVPEPGSLVLLGLALTAMAGIRRRQARR
jgi:hypothetical protein